MKSRPPAVIIAAAVITVAFFALPLIGLVQQVSWSTLGSDLARSQATDALRLSVVCSFCAAALSALFGLPLAFVLARVPFRGRSVVRGLVILPLVMPPVVGGVALLSAFSRGGIVGGWLYDAFGVQLTFTTAGTVLAETFVALPFFVITVESGLRALDLRYEESATTLGADRWERFRRVTLPMLAPSVWAGALLAWARALGEFGATITFAGNIAGRTQTLPLAIYLELDAHPEVAVALSLVLVVVSLAVIIGLRERWLGAI